MLLTFTHLAWRIYKHHSFFCAFNSLLMLTEWTTYIEDVMQSELEQSHLIANDQLTQFNDTGYCVVKNALSPILCEFLSQYARFRYQTSPNVLNSSDPLEGIHREYGNSVMELLLLNLRGTVEKYTGMNLWPTLSFYYTYRKGNLLKKHKDRDSCEVVACLCLGMDEKYSKEHKSWSIYLEKDAIETAVLLEPGDIVIFKGNKMNHWRQKFQGEWFVSAIFAYVAKDGDHTYLKYDQRKKIGDKHIGVFFWLAYIFIHKIKKKLYSLFRKTSKDTITM